MKKITIFIIILVIIFGGYYYWNKTNEQTVTDTKYGFEVKIPGNWSSDKSVNQSGQTVYKLEDQNNTTTKIGINIPVDSNSKPNTSTLPQKETINGYETDHYIIAQDSVELYVINHNNQTLWMLLSYTPNTKETVKQIVSTLKYK